MVMLDIVLRAEEEHKQQKVIKHESSYRVT